MVRRFVAPRVEHHPAVFGRLSPLPLGESGPWKGVLLDFGEVITPAIW